MTSKQRPAIWESLMVALWSFAEATVFFIAADFVLSFRGQHNLKRGLYLSIIAALAALVGGSLMYWWSLQDAVAAIEFQEQILSQSHAHSERIRTALNDHGMWSYFYGNVMGLPYSMYAVWTPVMHIGFIEFLIIGFVMRCLRFSATVLLIYFLTRCLPKQLSKRMHILLLMLGWSVFYAWYWGLGV